MPSGFRFSSAVAASSFFLQLDPDDDGGTGAPFLPLQLPAAVHGAARVTSADADGRTNYIYIYILDVTPARMTVFVDGVPLAVQCEYDFPKDGRAWFPSVSLSRFDALHSCAM